MKRSQGKKLNLEWAPFSLNGEILGIPSPLTDKLLQVLLFSLLGAYKEKKEERSRLGVLSARDSCCNNFV
jgi:hypothetical protein